MFRLVSLAETRCRSASHRTTRIAEAKENRSEGSERANDKTERNEVEFLFE